MSVLSPITSATGFVSDLGWRVFAVIIENDPTPEPLPPSLIDENQVTPTWIGFAMTFIVALATVFLLIDMMRRVRRTRYRAEIQEKLAAEAAEAEAAEATRSSKPKKGPRTS
jgi:TRAP-type C4-dicarboxylate transport system permease small subunit